ncbi:DUF6084 family protein [Saccharopolyspora phatthalungensis]|uniref:Uncharacterized protein n=1 Tax=Saccharopolyspora phatthalungensis TaxID=664693 RepID=A0A840PXU5_9PSEU|nr:DUF6084 family protein [Saccharopolyspora phatthalungensis]MBB5152580.1 hypothetical protein [Saccharopolyspora phatthalungensis]
MSELSFECLDIRPELYGAGPVLRFRLRIAEHRAERIHSIALRCQIRIEPQRREYDEHETELLGNLFGGRDRWRHTLRAMHFATASVLVPGFTGSTEVELAVPCTYDMEVASGKYFHSLRDGVVPFALLFSGTVFGKGDNGFWVQQVPWHQEASHAMPAKTWRELMDAYFPHATWIRLHRETVDALLRFKAAHAVPTWDAAVETLLAKAGEAS